MRFALQTPEAFKKTLKQEVARRVRDGQLELPMLPHIAQQVLLLAQKPDASVREMANLIEQDQYIAGRLISVANSPVYYGLHEVSNVQRAIMMLGLRVVTDLIFSVSVGAKIYRNKQFEGLMNELWRHAVASAYIAQDLTQRFGGTSEHAFLCGLMHDIGKPLIVDTLTDLTKRHPEEFPAALLSDEFVREILDEFHAPVGGLVARRWKFPESLSAAIVFHHEPLQDGQVIEPALLAAVANIFSHACGLGDRDTVRDPATHPFTKAFGITAEQAARVLPELEANATMFVDAFL
ncbi:MAG: HDOD domain-containing protein [Deltaproteobacteria bacterium]|nr:HDOD domain-containing protein [Deltaproteobacteria bacterium]